MTYNSPATTTVACVALHAMVDLLMVDLLLHATAGGTLSAEVQLFRKRNGGGKGIGNACNATTFSSHATTTVADVALHVLWEA
mmetsp:Transcript_6556/g.14417  ORF Transcript_6556/g.14417 Transcript_6556/m.14417 type:complete len:83 (+) Transcript_6556:780-1028(+)